MVMTRREAEKVQVGGRPGQLSAVPVRQVQAGPAGPPDKTVILSEALRSELVTFLDLWPESPE